jgi:hypothetical protein
MKTTGTAAKKGYESIHPCLREVDRLHRTSNTDYSNENQH